MSSSRPSARMTVSKSRVSAPRPLPSSAVRETPRRRRPSPVGIRSRTARRDSPARDLLGRGPVEGEGRQLGLVHRPLSIGPIVVAWHAKPDLPWRSAHARAAPGGRQRARSHPSAGARRARGFVLAFARESAARAGRPRPPGSPQPPVRSSRRRLSLPRRRGRGSGDPLLRRGRRVPGLRAGDGLRGRAAGPAGSDVPGKLLALRRHGVLAKPDVPGPRTADSPGVGRAPRRGGAGRRSSRRDPAPVGECPTGGCTRRPGAGAGDAVGAIQGGTDPGPRGRGRPPGRGARRVLPGQRRLARPRRALRGPRCRQRRSPLARVARRGRPPDVRSGPRPGGRGRRATSATA